ncbi:MAG TPA: universal stress protein [Micromonosporaceae bacterium]
MAGDDDRIVVGVDGSEPSRAALAWALQQAELTHASVEAVIAWEFPVFSVGQVLLPPEDPESIAARVLAEAVTATAGDRPVEVRQRVVGGHPAQTLIDAAHGARLLVVGNRGLGTFSAALLGSVASYCIQHASCPVVVVRGPTG